MTHRRGGLGVVSRGFTLIELLVVVAIIALLISILLPSLGRAKELANRVHCSANLRGITQSMHIYSEENGGTYPSVKPPASATYSLSFATAGSGTSTDINQSLLSTEGKVGDPLACLWIMVLQRTTVPKLHLCKSDRNVYAPAAFVDSANRYYHNFQGADQISYSIAYPWISSGSTFNVGPWWRQTLNSSVPVASDMAPLSGDYNVVTNTPPGGGLNKYSSPNHESKGQNVSFADVHVEWTTTPYVGSNGTDNIWTVGTGNGSPITSFGTLPGTPSGGSDFYDVVMVPVRKTSDGTMQ